VLDNTNWTKALDLNDSRKQAKGSLPKGIFAIMLVSLVGLVAGLLDKSQNSPIFTIVLGVDVLVAAGLFVRKEVVRKFALGLAIITVTMSTAMVLSYRGLADNAVAAEALFVAEAKKLQNQSPTKQLTHDQQQHLDAMQLKLEAQKMGVGKNSPIIYGKYGATIVLFAAVAVYLTRSKVKEAFAPV